jgi:hypothetical protein
MPYASWMLPQVRARCRADDRHEQPHICGDQADHAPKAVAEARHDGIAHQPADGGVGQFGHLAMSGLARVSDPAAVSTRTAGAQQRPERRSIRASRQRRTGPTPHPSSVVPTWFEVSANSAPQGHENRRSQADQRADQPSLSLGTAV